MTPLVTAANLTKTYGHTTVVDNVSLTIQPRRNPRPRRRIRLRQIHRSPHAPAPHRTHLRQPSRFDSTNVLAANKSQLRALRQRMQMVFQDPYGALNPRMSIRDIVAEPFHIHNGFSRSQPRHSREHIRARIHELLEEVGLGPDIESRYPHEFSGGQRQRINIARALALKPEFLALDEPVSALDVSVGAQVINLLQSLQRTHGLTYLFISHSMPLVRYLCDRVAVMQRGRLVEIGPALEVCDHPREPYTRALIAATPALPSTLPHIQ